METECDQSEDEGGAKD